MPSCCRTRCRSPASRWRRGSASAINRRSMSCRSCGPPARNSRQLNRRSSRRSSWLSWPACAATRLTSSKWGHFNWPAGTINVAPTEFLHVKSEMSARTVWLPPEMLEAFHGYCERASGRFVIESVVKPITNREHYRCAGVFDRLIAWLRAHGVTGQKSLHALRKEYGSLVSQHFGLYAAQRALGHASIQTTASHYLEVKERPIVALGHLLPAPKDSLK
jgi:integrase